MPGVFGHIAGVEVGARFRSRSEVLTSKVHRQLQAGIQGNKSDGAESIVVSGGYEDDEDLGEVIIYTGQGGRDPSTNRQIADQELTRGNLALARSHALGRPVRVIRGAVRGNAHAPDNGYRYDGLFSVESFWSDKGASGFVVWRFKLTALDIEPQPSAEPETRRERQTTLRIIRNSELAIRIKELHSYACQVCGTRLRTLVGPYVEGAHIRSLGSPHHGPDSLDNMLCLCPNHHILFDRGAFTILNDLSLNGISGALRTVDGHIVNVQHLAYHHEHYKRQVVVQDD